MKTIYIILASLLLISCASENEKKGLDEVAALYNATASYSKGISSAVGKKTIKRFNIKLSDSKLLDSLPITESAANIALTVFKNFDKKEKNNYTELHVEFINSKNDTLAYSFPVRLLQRLLPKIKAYTIFSESIMSGDFERIDNYKNSDYIGVSVVESLKKYTTELTERYGDIVDYQPYGLVEVKDGKKSLARFLGFFNFSNGKQVAYSVTVDMPEGKEKIAGYRIF
ncbi:MAG TPA: hypothetical protein ENK46_04480 [Flavobacteriia bacterium]|nr:hypothetical protein [Flavobacteriia bacterium]